MMMSGPPGSAPRRRSATCRQAQGQYLVCYLQSDNCSSGGTSHLTLIGQGLLESGSCFIQSTIQNLQFNSVAAQVFREQVNVVQINWQSME